jgi:hypothetical protein
MKSLEEIYPNLTRHQKAYILIGPRHRGWSFKDVCDHVRESAGEDVDAASIRKYLETNDVFLVESGASRKRRLPRRGPASNQNIDKQLVRDAKKADSEGQFDPKNIKEAREWVQRRINLRRGQPEFRTKLLNAYSRRCAITGCNCPDALEAAHILPYRGQDTNHIQNGILLRSDVHTLFDLGKIGINPVTHKVIVSKSLSGTAYARLKGKKVRFPSRSGIRPNAEVLRKHVDQWGLRPL